MYICMAVISYLPQERRKFMPSINDLMREME